MTTLELQNALTTKHQDFIDLLIGLSEDEFLFRPNPEKWSNGENLKHILQSTNPLSQALFLPKFQMKLMFGKANRPSRTYDELVEKYHGKLEKGGKASGKYIPNTIAFDQRESLSNKVMKIVKKITKQLNSFSEEDLDNFILPHPLIGKLTLREMMYFTIYHVQHHQRIVEKNLDSKNK